MAARDAGKKTGRSPSEQIESWVCLGKLAEDNSELTGQVLLDILNAKSPGL